jgi:O-succinylbenzoic acid--CoA ligase
VTPRRLEPLAVPAGAGVLGLLPALRAALCGDGPAVLPHLAGTTPAAALGPGEPLAPGEDDEADPTVAVVATSGSTGDPKGALLTASALLASASATHDRLGGPGRWLLALPADHVAGLQVLLRAMVTGTEPGIVDLLGGFDPAAFTAAARALPGHRRYTALVPTQVRRLLDAGGAARAALASLDAVLVGGAATPPPLLAEARAAGVRVVTTYGMSETCGGCIYDGRPLGGVRAEVDGQGRVRLGGPTLARGYRGGDPAGAFSTDGDGVRWFRTGDAGILGPDGSLTVLGRLDDVIVTGGLKVAPGVVENALLAIPGVTEAVVVGVPDREWGERIVAFVVPAPGGEPPTLDVVRRLVTDRAGRHAAPHQLLVLERLPLRGPGKPDRARLRQLAENGHAAGPR